jgi:hypothetical protein
MRGYNKWSYRPYLPAVETERKKQPYICRLAPYEDRCEIEWIGEGTTFTVLYCERGTDAWKHQTGDKRQTVIKGLEPEKEYEIKVRDIRGGESPIRLIRTSPVEGVVINYLHPEDEQYSFSGRYLCSPSLVKLPSGRLLASMDVYGPQMSQNLTLLYDSVDGGKTWNYVADIFPCFWGKMFTHKGKLYLMGVSNEYGDILIGCSEDEGRSWGTPEVILRGSSDTKELGNHRAPMVMLNSHGRIWTGIEYGAWKKHKFYDSLLSVDENADLMKAENWTLTDFVGIDPYWPGVNPDVVGAIEGNAVETPEGQIIDFLRYGENKALILKANPKEPERELEFVRFVNFPLGHTKFEIQRREDGIYFALGNPFPGRTVLSLYQSEDLEDWKKVCDVITHPEYDIKEVGFQYPVFLFEGHELLILSRTAWNHAHDYHDSNYITFHRVNTMQKQ